MFLFVTNYTEHKLSLMSFEEKKCNTILDNYRCMCIWLYHCVSYNVICTYVIVVSPFCFGYFWCKKKQKEKKEKTELEKY